MKVVMATTEYPPTSFGGSAESVRLQAEALVRAGHEVTVVTPRWDRVTPSERVGGVAVVRVDVGQGLPAGHAVTEWMVVGSAFNMPMPIMDACRRVGADVLHAQDRRMIGPVARAVRGLSIPVVLTLRDVGLLCPIATCLLSSPTIPADCGQWKLATTCGPEYRQRYAITGSLVALGARLAVRYRGLAWDRAAAEKLAAVTFVSAGLRRVYQGAGWPPDDVRTFVTPSPVDPAPPIADEVAAQLKKSHRLTDKPLVLFVGKPSLGKGYPCFAAAAEALYMQAHFVHVGPVPSPVTDAAVHVGVVPHETALAWMRAADLVMVPSVQADALPRVALEAQAQGTLVLGSMRGGVPEAVVSGYLEIPEAKAMTWGVRRALETPAPWTRAEVRERVLWRFGPEATTAKLLAVYRAVRA
jgi:glycosyltransferase involved in cell wall biosynthesis